LNGSDQTLEVMRAMKLASALAAAMAPSPARRAFTSAAEANARKIAALLGIRYRRLADGEFDHSQPITLLDRQGRARHDDKVDRRRGVRGPASKRSCCHRLLH
jgi:hypothetical protein